MCVTARFHSSPEPLYRAALRRWHGCPARRRALRTDSGHSIFGHPAQQEREADPILAHLQPSGMCEAEEAHGCPPSARRQGEGWVGGAELLGVMPPGTHECTRVSGAEKHTLRVSERNMRADNATIQTAFEKLIIRQALICYYSPRGKAHNNSQDTGRILKS